MPKRACVRCGTDFNLAAVGSVEVDVCRTCGGLWLDASELQQLSEMKDEALQGLHELVRRGAESKGGAPYRSGAPDPTSEERRLDSPCPACTGKLTSAVVGSIHVELCSGCGGVFLDPGELELATAEVRGRAEKLATIAAMARTVSTHGTIGK
jgi:Zn-finger nucleic acid-binding protein